MNSLFVVRIAGVSALLAVIAQFGAMGSSPVHRSTSATALSSWPLAT